MQFLSDHNFEGPCSLDIQLKHWMELKVSVFKSSHTLNRIYYTFIIFITKLKTNQLEKLEAVFFSLLAFACLSLGSTGPYYALLDLTVSYWALLNLLGLLSQPKASIYGFTN